MTKQEEMELRQELERVNQRAETAERIAYERFNLLSEIKRIWKLSYDMGDDWGIYNIGDLIHDNPLMKANLADVNVLLSTSEHVELRLALEEENFKLRQALEDMLLLIEEHGSPLMRSHATKLLKARSALEEK